MSLLLGDLFDVLPTLGADSIDAGATDPPYGLGFMGKQWDTFKPGMVAQPQRYEEPIVSDNPNLRGRRRSPAVSVSQIAYDRTLNGQREFQAWSERWGCEVLRVLKPGAHVVVCGAPRSYHRMAAGLEDAGFEIRDCLAWIFGQGFPKSLNFDDGWGTGLKPAYEPILLARKPFKGSIEKNRAQHGTGAINVDGCRIDAQGETWEREPGTVKPSTSIGTFQTEARSVVQDDLGRWPSNVLLDEIAAKSMDEMSGELYTAGNKHTAQQNQGGVFGGGRIGVESVYQDSGGASRFFYVAKPSRAERDQGCEHLEPKQRDDSRKEGNPGGDNPRNRGLQRRGNHHPTVKPVELMRYLVRLVTPVGGTLLDPFAGSGTTGMACAFEGVNFIGIEREAEYVEIAERRIASCVPLFSEFTA